MKCPVCLEKGLRSTVSVGMSTTTCMGFSPGHYDENGEWVAGVDPNYTTTDHRCSHGHRFASSVRQGEPPKLTVISAAEECQHWRNPNECPTCLAQLRLSEGAGAAQDVPSPPTSES